MTETDIKSKLLSKIDSFLALKPRTRYEVEVRLKKYVQKFSELTPAECTSVISEVLDYLQEQKVLDDTRYAQDYIDYLRHSSKHKSPLQLKKFFITRGLSTNLIEQIVESLPQESQFESITQLAQKRLRVYQKFEPSKRRRMLYTYLAQKGFSPELVMRAVDSILGVK